MDEWFKQLVEIETHLYATIGVLEEQNEMCAETAIKYCRTALQTLCELWKRLEEELRDEERLRKEAEERMKRLEEAKAV